MRLVVESAPGPSTLPIVRWVLIGLAVSAPLMFGGVTPTALLVIQLGAAFAGLALVWGALDGNDNSIPHAGLAVAVLATLVALVVLQTLSGVAPDHIDALLRVSMYVFLAVLAAGAFRTPPQLRTLRLAIAISAAAIAVYGCSEYLSGHQHLLWIPKVHGLDSASGTFVNRNHFGIFLAIALPAALGELYATDGPERRSESSSRTRIAFGLLASFAIVVGIVLSYSRAALGCAVAASTVFAALVFRGRRGAGWIAVAVLVPVIWTLALPVPVIGARFFDAAPDELASLSNRVPAWSVCLDMVAERPLIGAGLGNFPAAFRSRQPAEIDGFWLSAHNDWLQFLVEGGVVLFGIGLIALVGVAVALRPRRVTGRLTELELGNAIALGSLLALTMHSLIDFPYRIPGVVVPAVVLCAATMGVSSRSRRS